MENNLCVAFARKIILKVVVGGSRYSTNHCLPVSKSEGGSSERECRCGVNLTRYKACWISAPKVLDNRKPLDRCVFLFHLKTREVIVLQQNVGAFRG